MPSKLACEMIVNHHLIDRLLHCYLPFTASFLLKPALRRALPLGFPFPTIRSQQTPDTLANVGFRLRLGPILKLCSHFAGYPGNEQFHPSVVDTALLAVLSFKVLPQRPGFPPPFEVRPL